MLSITLCRFCDGVTETVVPGHTCTSPPDERLTTAVSGPAVIVEPEPASFPVRANGLAVRTEATTGCGDCVRLGTVGVSNGELRAWSDALPRCTTRRLPAASHVKARGARRSTTTRAI